MNRAVLLATSRAAVFRPLFARRTLHKGAECSPPLRFTSVSEQLVLFSAITVAFLSYPTYVLLNLNNLRPLPGEQLNPETQAKLDAARAVREASRHK